MNFLQNLFSIVNQDNHKVITILGVKIKYKNINKCIEDCNNEIKSLKASLNHSVNKIALEQKKQLEQIRADEEVLLKQGLEIKKSKEELLKNEKTLKDVNTSLVILNREKNLSVSRFNYLIDKLGMEDLKELVLQQKFFYNNNNYWLNIENPKSFNEKIHWLRKHYLLDNPLTDKISDKLLFKDYISEKLGKEYIVPLLGMWENPYDIDYEMLPDKFVLKSTWGGDGSQVLIVRDKSKLNIEQTNRKLSEWIAPWGNPYYYAFTPIFKNIKPAIIAEEYIEELDVCVCDYKFFCFNGEPKLFYIANNWAGGEQKVTYYDMNFEPLDLVYSSHNKVSVEKPDNFEEMVNLAKILSEGFPFVRVDFFNTKDRLYVGEMTFTPGGGFGKYNPVEWDYKLGEMLDLTSLLRVGGGGDC